MSSNPYAAPAAPIAEVTAPGVDHARLARIASGQKMMVWAVILQFVFGFANASTRSVGISALIGIATLACLVFAIIGAVRVARGLGTNIVMCVFGAIFMIIPLVNLITMLTLSIRATRALRAAGYEVGLVGARKP